LQEESIHRAHQTNRGQLLSLMIMLKIKSISITLISMKMNLKLKNMGKMSKQARRIHQTRMKKVHNQLKPSGLKKRMKF